MGKEGRVLAFTLLGMLLLLGSNLQKEPLLDRIVAFRGDADLGAIESTGAVVLDRFWIIEAAHVSATEGQLEKIAGLPSVSGIYPNRVLHPMLAQSVPLIGAALARQQGFNGTGVKIAILDTGINSSYADISGRVINQSDCTFSPCAANNPPANNDSSGHGTLMAIIAAGANASGYGYGVAPAAGLIDAKVFHKEGNSWVAYESDVLKGMQYALDPDGLGSTRDGADIILMSFGAADSPEAGCAGPASDAIDNAVSRGVLVVASNGDTGCINGTTYPACNRKVIAVGSTLDANNAPPKNCPEVCTGIGSSSSTVDDWFCYSSRGVDKWEGKIKPDIVAPGYKIEAGAAPYNNTFDSTSSSSMAAAHVAGAAAVLLQRIKSNWTGLKDPNPDTAGVNSSTAALKAILLNSANDLGSAGRDDKYGAGRLNVTEGLSESNATYVQYCNRWAPTVGDVDVKVKLYHQVNVSPGAKNLSVTLYWEENNKTSHKNLGLTLRNPSNGTYSESSPTADVVRQIRVGSPENGTWYVIVENVNQQQTKYVLASNYPLVGCQPSTLTSVSISFYNGTRYDPHYQRNDFYPSNHYDWLEEYAYNTQVVQYRIQLYDQFGQNFDAPPETTLAISYQNGSSNSKIDFATAPLTNTITGTFVSWDAVGNYEIPLPEGAAASYTGADWINREWYLDVSFSNCGLGCPSAAPTTKFYVNRTYGLDLGAGVQSGTLRYDAVGTIAVNVTNRGNVGDLYDVRWSNNFTSNSRGIGTSGRCSFSIAANPLGAEFHGVGSTTIDILPASTLTGGDYCWMEVLNATSQGAIILRKNTSQDDGMVTKANFSQASPNCDGLPLNYNLNRNYAYFTYTPMEGNVYVKETDLAISAYPTTSSWKNETVSKRIAFSLYYAKDDNGDFVPNDGETYHLAFTRSLSDSVDDTLQAIEVSSTPGNYQLPLSKGLMQFKKADLGYGRYMLLKGQKYSFKVVSLNRNMFQLAFNNRSGENATGGCSDNVVDNSSAQPTNCLCKAPGGSAIARFFGHASNYGYDEIRNGIGVYITDTITYLNSTDYSSQVCEGDLEVESMCRPKYGNLAIYRNSTKIYFRSYPKTHNLPANTVDVNNLVYGATVALQLFDGNNTRINMGNYTLNCGSLPCISNSTMTMPHYNSLGQPTWAGIWKANFSASAPYFTNATQMMTFTVRGKTNISITNAQSRYYRGTAYSLNATVRNEFGDLESPDFFSALWEVHNGTGAKTINASKDIIYVFREEVGAKNVSANASGTYLDASRSVRNTELWDRLGTNISITPDPSYQLGSYLNFSINVTSALNETVASGIGVTCNITAVNGGNGNNLTATFSGGLWGCVQFLDKETTSIGNAQVRTYAAGNFYESSSGSLAFTVLGANLSTVVSAPQYSFTGGEFNLSFTITNYGNANSSNAHFSLILPAELVRASGNWSERDLNDSEALGHNIRPGESFNYTWRMNATSNVGNYTVNLSVTADNGPSVLVIKPFEVRSTMYLSVQSPVVSNATMPANVTVNVTNIGEYEVLGANITLVLGQDIELTGGNLSYGFSLQTGANRSFRWEVSTDLGARLPVVFNVTSANAGTFAANTTLITSNYLRVAIAAPTASAQANVTDYESFNALVNVTHNRTVITDLYLQNVSARIGGYPANITALAFQNGMWNLTLTAPPELSESSNNTLQVMVAYYNTSAPINRTYNVTAYAYRAVHSREIPPSILGFSMPPAFEVGNQSRINVSAYDKSNLSYLSGTFQDLDGNRREYNFSLVSAYGYYRNYTYLFTPSVEGNYNLTFRAMDGYGSSSSNLTNFSVYGPPRIRKIAFLGSKYLLPGENISMVVNATSHISPVTVIVNISNSTTVSCGVGCSYTVTDSAVYDTQQIAAGYRFTRNFSGNGTYSVTAIANDTYGNRVSYGDFFIISSPVLFIGNFSLNGSVSLNPSGTGDERISLNGTFFTMIPAGTYDVYARTSDGNLTVKLIYVTILSNVSGRVVSLVPKPVSSSAFAGGVAYDVSTNFTYANISIQFRYSPSYAGSRVSIFKCSYPAWNDTACTGSWLKLNTTVDTGTLTANSTVSNLSAFSVGQERVLAASIKQISPSSGLAYGTPVLLYFNVSLDGIPQETGITPRAWFDSAELNVSTHAASGFEHNLSSTAPSATSVSRSVTLQAAYQGTGAADYITATDTIAGGVNYSGWCGDGVCSGGETCGSCQSDCDCTGGGSPGGGGGSSGTSAPVAVPSAPTQPIQIIEYTSYVSVVAGENTSMKFTVKNTGSSTLNVSITFDTLQGWIRTNGSKLINKSAQADFYLYYNVPGYAQPGVYPYLILVMSKNATLANRTATLEITAPPQVETPAGNETPVFTPPPIEGRYLEVKGKYQSTKNDLVKLGLFGYKVTALQLELDNAGKLIDEAGANLSSPSAPEKLDLAEAAINKVRGYASKQVSDKYDALSKERPGDGLSEANAALAAGDFGKAAYLMDQMEKAPPASPAGVGTSIVYSVLLLAVLLAAGGVGYYNREELRIRIEDITQKSTPLQIEDVQSKLAALRGRRVAITGNVIASGERPGGFWLKVKDVSGEMLVWNKAGVSIGQLIEVRGILCYDKGIDTWYIESRMERNVNS